MDIFWKMIDDYRVSEKDHFDLAKDLHLQAFGDTEKWARLEVERDSFFRYVDEKKKEGIDRSVEWQIVLLNLIMDRYNFFRAIVETASSRLN